MRLSTSTKVLSFASSLSNHADLSALVQEVGYELTFTNFESSQLVGFDDGLIICEYIVSTISAQQYRIIITFDNVSSWVVMEVGIVE